MPARSWCPALNRDGDCLSDLVLALFGSIAGAESVLLALDDDLRTVVAMAEAPHGTAPSLHGEERRQPDGDAPGLRRRARPRSAGDAASTAAAAAIRRATLAAAADGIRTFDLGGEASTSEVVDEVLARLRREHERSLDRRRRSPLALVSQPAVRPPRRSTPGDVSGRRR